MDAGLKDLLNSYRAGLKTYFDSLPNDNAEVMKANKLLAEMESLAQRSSDYSAFMEEAQSKNYFAEIITFHSKLGNELYKSKPKSTKIPSASDIAKGYHSAFESMGELKNDPEISAVYSRVFQLEKEVSSGPEFIYRMESENLFLQMSKKHLIRVMRDGLDNLLNSGKPSVNEKIGIVSSPQMEHYFTTIQKKIIESKTVIEMEIIAFEEAENSRFSNLWDSTFLFVTFHSILSPLVSYRMTGSEEDRLDTKHAYEFVCDFYGLNWDDLFENSRIWDYFEKTVFGAAKDTFLSQNIHSAKELKTDFRNHLAKCVENIEMNSDRNKQKVNFRGKEIELKDVLKFLKSE